MTSGPRQIRVACAKCGYDKQRTLAAGDDRTLEQLSASLRCGGCRAWGKNGAISVSPTATPKKRRTQRSAHESSVSRIHPNVSNRDSGAIDNASQPNSRPALVHGACLNCGHTETFKPKWRRGETLDSLARAIACPECGAEGPAGNIYLREASSRTQRPHKSKIPLQVGASIIATLVWPFKMLGLLVVMPLAALAVAIGRLLERIWGPLLMGGSVFASIAAGFGAAYVAAILIGAAMSGPAELVLRAVEHEYGDAIRNSPKGGYQERADKDYAETPRQMTYYNRRSVGDADRD